MEQQSLAKKLFNRYLVDGLGALAYGLFGSIIIGVVFKQLFALIALFWTGAAPLAEAIAAATASSSPVVGAVIGCAVGYGLKSKPLAMYSAGVAGAVGYSVVAGDVPAGPMGAFIAAIVAAEIGTWVSGKTPIDIVAVPLSAVLSGSLAGLIVGAPIAAFMLALGSFVNTAATLNPWIAAPLIAIVLGLALSGPISSAALAIMLGLTGAAAGAATAGCCAQMIGFALISFKDNGVGGLLAQGLGTSKIQLPNIMRKPIVIVPTLVAGVIASWVATVAFNITNSPIGAGMGTCGLIGPIAAYGDMLAAGQTPGSILIAMGIALFLTPALVAYGVYFVLENRGFIRPGDMRLQRD